MLAVTADGYELSLTPDGLKRIAARLDDSGLRPLVKRFYDGDLRRAVRRAVRRLAGNSHRIGSLRNVETGRRSVVFGTHSAGTTYNLVTRPVTVDRFEVVSVNATEDVEFSDGYHHRRLQNEIVEELMRRGMVLATSDAHRTEAGYIRDNRYQVLADGTLFIGEGRLVPDVSYIDMYGRRVNIEIDTRETVKKKKDGTEPEKKGSMEHLRALVEKDPTAVHIGIVIDPVTGKVVSRRAYAPAGYGYGGDNPKPAANENVGHPEAPHLALPPPKLPEGGSIKQRGVRTAPRMPSLPPPNMNHYPIMFKPRAGMQNIAPPQRAPWPPARPVRGLWPNMPKLPNMLKFW